MAADATAKLRRLYQAGLEHHEKTGEILAEIGKVLNGETGVGDIMRSLTRELSEIWQARYRAPYVWQGAKDSASLKKLLKTLKPDEIKARWMTYLKTNDRYYIDARHGFTLFASQVNRFTGLDTLGDEFSLDVDAPADCHHHPRCKTDQEHTRRRNAELRA